MLDDVHELTWFLIFSGEVHAERKRTALMGDTAAWKFDFAVSATNSAQTDSKHSNALLSTRVAA